MHPGEGPPHSSGPCWGAPDPMHTVKPLAAGPGRLPRRRVVGECAQGAGRGARGAGRGRGCPHLSRPGSGGLGASVSPPPGRGGSAPAPREVARAAGGAEGPHGQRPPPPPGSAPCAQIAPLRPPSRPPQKRGTGARTRRRPPPLFSQPGLSRAKTRPGARLRGMEGGALWGGRPQAVAWGWGWKLGGGGTPAARPPCPVWRGPAWLSSPHPISMSCPQPQVPQDWGVPQKNLSLLFPILGGDSDSGGSGRLPGETEAGDCAPSRPRSASALRSWFTHWLPKPRVGLAGGLLGFDPSRHPIRSLELLSTTGCP